MARPPKFSTDQEEAEFWDTHDSTQFLEGSEPAEVAFLDNRPTKKLISLRLDPEVIDQLRVVAKQKGIGYQTLIRMWVMDRLSAERP